MAITLPSRTYQPTSNAIKRDQPHPQPNCTNSAIIVSVVFGVLTETLAIALYLKGIGGITCLVSLSVGSSLPILIPLVVLWKFPQKKSVLPSSSENRNVFSVQRTRKEIVKRKPLTFNEVPRDILFSVLDFLPSPSILSFSLLAKKYYDCAIAYAKQRVGLQFHGKELNIQNQEILKVISLVKTYAKKEPVIGAYSLSEKQNPNALMRPLLITEKNRIFYVQRTSPCKIYEITLSTKEVRESNLGKHGASYVTRPDHSLYAHSNEWDSTNMKKYHWGNKIVVECFPQKFRNPFPSNVLSSDIHADLAAYSLENSKEIVVLSRTSLQEKLRLKSSNFIPHFIKFCPQKTGKTYLIAGSSSLISMPPYFSSSNLIGGLLQGFSMLGKLSSLLILDTTSLNSLSFSTEGEDFSAFTKPLSEIWETNIATLLGRQVTMWPGTIRSLEACGKWLVVANEFQETTLIVFDLEAQTIRWNLTLKKQGVYNLKLKLSKTTLFATYTDKPVEYFCMEGCRWDLTTGNQTLAFHQSHIEILHNEEERWFLYQFDLISKKGKFQSYDFSLSQRPIFEFSDETFLQYSIDRSLISVAEKDGTVWIRDLARGNQIFKQKIPQVSSVQLKQSLLVVGKENGDMELWSVNGSFLLRKISQEAHKILHVEIEKNKILALSDSNNSQAVLCFDFSQ